MLFARVASTSSSSVLPPRLPPAAATNDRHRKLPLTNVTVRPSVQRHGRATTCMTHSFALAKVSSTASTLHTSIVCAACGRSWTHFFPPSRTITASSSRSAKENSPLSMAPRQRISPPSSLEQESREPLVPKLQAVDEESEKARQHHDYFNLFALVSSGKLEC